MFQSCQELRLFLYLAFKTCYSARRFVKKHVSFNVGIFAENTLYFKYTIYFNFFNHLKYKIYISKRFYWFCYYHTFLKFQEISKVDKHQAPRASEKYSWQINSLPALLSCGNLGEILVNACSKEHSVGDLSRHTFSFR